jgi:hypothetical protein
LRNSRSKICCDFKRAIQADPETNISAKKSVGKGGRGGSKYNYLQHCAFEV